MSRFQTGLMRVLWVCLLLAIGHAVGLLVTFLGVALILDAGESSASLGWKQFAPLIALPLVFGVGVWLACKRPRWKPAFVTLGVAGVFVVSLGRDVDAPPALIAPGPELDATAPVAVALAWLTPDHPQNRLSEVRPGEALPQIDFPANAGDWPAYLDEHRATLEALWQQDALGRAWVALLAAEEPAGLCANLEPPGESPNPRFSVVRQIVRLHLAQVYRLDADGAPEEAAALLELTIRAFQNFQRGTVTLVNQMVANVCLRLAYTAGADLISRHELAPETRARLHDTLLRGLGASGAIDRSVYGENLFFRRQLLGSSALAMENVPWAARLPGAGILWHPNRTATDYTRALEALAAEAKSRDLSDGDLAPDTVIGPPWRPNPVGRALIFMAVPAFRTVAKSFHSLDDQRDALVAATAPQAPDFTLTGGRP